MASFGRQQVLVIFMDWKRGFSLRKKEIHAGKSPVQLRKRNQGPNFAAMFRNRNLVIATKHRKEVVIGPLLEKELGVRYFVPEDFDTDVLGTFSGEIERVDDPVTTLRKKCLMAMEQTNCTLGVASEGSFGPHPHIFFVPANDEMMIFIDRENNLEILARTLSTDTNFNGAEIKNIQQLKDFAETTGFPAHGLILRPAKNDYSSIQKGINNLKQLEAAYNTLAGKYGTVYAETDMRALYNPSRMQVIAQTAEKLVAKIQSACPACSLPGFDVTDMRSGLPCSLCGLPTDSILYHDYACRNCGYQKEVKYPKGKTHEDPMYCNHCNP